MTFWHGSSAINELHKLISYVATESIQEQVSLALQNPVARDIFLNADQIMPLAGLKPLRGTSSLPGPKTRLINLVHKTLPEMVYAFLLYLISLHLQVFS